MPYLKWFSIGPDVFRSEYRDLKFIITKDENDKYDLITTLGLGNQIFSSQNLDSESFDAAKNVAEGVVRGAYKLPVLEESNAVKEAALKRGAATKRFYEAQKTWLILANARIVTVVPKLDDFLNDENYVWVARTIDGKLVDTSKINVTRPI